MNVNVIGVLFILESEKNQNIRKNDIKKLNILVDKQTQLPAVIYDEKNLKEQIRECLCNAIGHTNFHLEQVLTLESDNGVDVIYLGVTNAEDIKLNDNYEMVNFSLNDNKIINFGDKKYNYKTVEKFVNSSIEYIHEIDVKNEELRKILLYILICYKRIRSNIDNTDILFKFLQKTFTLEDVRMVYELVKDTSVDKSNFRKKIIKYCEKVDEDIKIKNGFRPSQRYEFKPLKGDIWL